MPSSPSLTTPTQVSPINRGICLPRQAAPLDRDPSPGAPSLLRHSIVITNSSRDRISNLLSISYASRPYLRPRLTLGGSTFPRNPWTSGECDSHTLRVTHAGILTSMLSTEPRRFDFSLHGTLPYRFGLTSNPQASVTCLAPCIFGATILDQ